MERRKRIRYALLARAEFRWETRDGTVLKGQGFTRDISSHGAYVYSEPQPPTGTDLLIDILLPTVLEPYGTLRMSGSTKVIRVELSVIDVHFGGFVAQSDSFELWEDLADFLK